MESIIRKVKRRMVVLLEMTAQAKVLMEMTEVFQQATHKRLKT